MLTVVANRTTIKSLSERKLLIMADAKEIEETALIDRNMDQVFDWAKGNEMTLSLIHISEHTRPRVI